LSDPAVVAARLELAAIERGAVARREEAEVRVGLRETLALALERGETARVLESGGIHVESRDAVLYLMNRGSLSARQFRAAREYETLSARLDPLAGLRPPGFDPDARGGGGDRETVAEGLRRINARMAEAHRVLASSHPLALEAVQRVAGQNMPLARFAPQRRLRERMLTGLALGLEALADLWRIT
jgi:hypothetical protein